ncbi:39S ribosomal protein L40, mitochondrial-like [Uloborus diversus]|uniref:39S ribosomal protein L40, mitochondrial-like n=1 Tax=Uloborus diversus TaxID=327109 RepID=UPI0024091600|nr:39S ribosomal protein L40, mitochondrial-like [Uloborus diversus]
MSSLISHFKLLSLRSCYGTQIGTRSIHIMNNPLYFRFTPALSAEPLRKKRRIDPAVLRERAEKKIKRIQRDIRRLEKVAKQFKPLAELEPPKTILRESDRARPPVQLSDAEIQERAEIKQQWAVYKRREHVAELNAIQSLISAQEKAMDALQEASPELYEEALQPDPALVPFTLKGPVETPPVENYDYPDGDYFDVTKQYKPIVPLDPKKQRRLGLLRKK